MHVLAPDGSVPIVLDDDGKADARTELRPERPVAPADEVGRVADAIAIRGQEGGDGHADRDDRVAALLGLPAQLRDEIGDRGQCLVVVAYPPGPALQRGHLPLAIHDPGHELRAAEIDSDRDVAFGPLRRTVPILHFRLHAIIS